MCREALGAISVPQLLLLPAKICSIIQVRKLGYRLPSSRIIEHKAHHMVEQKGGREVNRKKYPSVNAKSETVG